MNEITGLLTLIPAQPQQDAPPNPPTEMNPSGPQTPTSASQQAPAPAGDDPGTAQPPFDNNMIWIFLLIMVVMVVLSMGGQRKEKKKKKTMLAALKKGDKIQTVGGVLGTVVELRDSDVIVIVDENNNSRIKFVRSAIQSVTQEQE